MKLKYQLLINYDSRKTKKLQIDLNIFDRVIWITLFPFIPFFFINKHKKCITKRR